uniref:Uncharacterized protein n=1 Tax=Sphaerodactylus townsendi TaxID=933632 RepID=A0ACB8F7Y5_9SAUR
MGHTNFLTDLRLAHFIQHLPPEELWVLLCVQNPPYLLKEEQEGRASITCNVFNLANSVKSVEVSLLEEHPDILVRGAFLELHQLLELAHYPAGHTDFDSITVGTDYCSPCEGWPLNMMWKHGVVLDVIGHL